jgi:hypothetical protein
MSRHQNTKLVRREENLLIQKAFKRGSPEVANNGSNAFRLAENENERRGIGHTGVPPVTFRICAIRNGFGLVLSITITYLLYVCIIAISERFYMRQSTKTAAQLFRVAGLGSFKF